MGLNADALASEIAKPAYAGLSDTDCIPLLLAVTQQAPGSAMMSPSDFIALFAPAEAAAAIESVDAVVRQMMLRLQVQGSGLDLKSEAVQGGISYMAGAAVPGLGTIATPILTPDRAAAIMAVPMVSVQTFAGVTPHDVWVARGQPE